MTDNNLEQRALSIPDQIRAITITSPETYQQMAGVFLTIKALRKEIADTFNPLIQKAHESHRAILAEKKRHDEPLDKAEKEGKSAMQFYDAEQERIRREEERRLQEIARKAEEERKLQEALEAEQAGDKEAAEEILQEEIYVPPVSIPKATPKVSGVVFRTTWKHRVTNLKELVKAVAEGKAPLQCLQANDVFLGAQTRAMKTPGNIYPGVEAYSERA